MFSCLDFLDLEQELEWRRKFEKLMKDYEKLSGTMGETVLATEWRERYVACSNLVRDLGVII